MTAERLVCWWVDGYTRGLADEARSERRDELASDVWEHRAALGAGAGAQLALVSRCLRGIPADLSWRRSQRRAPRGAPSLRSVARGLGWALAAMGYALLLVMNGYVAAPLLGRETYEPDWDLDEVTAYARVAAVLFTLLVAGAVLLHRLPRTGAALVAAGAVGTMVAYWWAMVMWGPVGAAVTLAALALARPRRLQPRTSSATS